MSFSEVLLGDICKVGSSNRIFKKDYVEKGIPFYRSKEIINFAQNEEIKDILYISKEKFDEMNNKTGYPQFGDILLASIGANMGIAYYVTTHYPFYFKDGNVTWLKDFKNNVCSNYIYYWLISDKTQKYLLNTAIGSAQKAITINNLKQLKLQLPSILEQKAVARILSSLDDKIKINNQINKTLENMAQAIFTRWFVDFDFPNEDGEPYKSSGGEMVESELGLIPKGWEVKELGEIIDIIKQGTKPGEHLKDRKYNPIDTLPMKSIAINDFKPYEEAKSSLILFEKYDILIGAMRVYFHRVNLAPYKGITRTTTFVLRSKRVQDVPYNLFLLNMDKTIDYAERTSKGSTMPYAVWDNGMSNMLTAYSNIELRNKFFEIIQPMLETIMKRSAENEVLTKLRDSLLPKLMSGEIRVPLDEEGVAS